MSNIKDTTNYHIQIPFYEVVEIREDGFEDVIVGKRFFRDIIDAMDFAHSRPRSFNTLVRIRLYDGEEMLEEWIIRDFRSEPEYKEFYQCT